MVARCRRCFVVWQGDFKNFMVLIQQLNELDNNIQFAFGLENEGKLPFLDVELSSVTELIPSVYRKPIADLNIISFDACSLL